MEIFIFVAVCLGTMFLTGLVMLFPVFVYIISQQKSRIQYLENDLNFERSKRKEWMIVALNYRKTIERLGEQLKPFNIAIPGVEKTTLEELKIRKFETLRIEELERLLEHYQEEEKYEKAAHCRDRIKFLKEIM